ncbi:MAG: 23S rRNA (adenine(2503)-C(2))-methyltransferase RlmN [Bacteroidales bacterium]
MTEKHKPVLLGKTPEELRDIAESLGMAKFAGDQIASWLYRSNIQAFEEMTNLSKANREKLAEHYSPGLTAAVKVQVSSDGTKKYLFPTIQNKFIETALMPERTRNTLCVSTQVGCKMGCLFCMTGKQGFQGNLDASDIINQLRSIPEKEEVSNIVFMGMGEPFDNTEHLMRSLEILTSAWGFGISPKKITVSTIGLIPGMQVFLENSSCNLAISLHSPFDEERRHLMPVEHVFPIKDVIRTLEDSDFSRYRKLSFEYILFKGINDSPRHVKELARLLNKLKCRINLMRFHPVPNAPLQGSDEDTLLSFQKGLNEKGITATIRQSRGLDIDAACGMLSTKALLHQQRAEEE